MFESAAADEITTLIFDPDNPCNTTITDSDTCKVVYKVVTEHGKQTVTRVKNAAGETIASWEWRDVRSDIITLGDGTPVPTSAWLKKSLIPFKEYVHSTSQYHINWLNDITQHGDATGGLWRTELQMERKWTRTLI
jgi:hypothetical protein